MPIQTPRIVPRTSGGTISVMIGRLQPGVHLGFGRIVASEEEVQHNYVSESGMKRVNGSAKGQCERARGAPGRDEGEEEEPTRVQPAGVRGPRRRHQHEPDAWD
jgi:hypothetical protein